MNEETAKELEGNERRKEKQSGEGQTCFHLTMCCFLSPKIDDAHMTTQQKIRNQICRLPVCRPRRKAHLVHTVVQRKQFISQTALQAVRSGGNQQKKSMDKAAVKDKVDGRIGKTAVLVSLWSWVLNLEKANLV
jgi:hypothetical protein